MTHATIPGCRLRTVHVRGGSCFLPAAVKTPRARIAYADMPVSPCVRPRARRRSEPVGHVPPVPVTSVQIIAPLLHGKLKHACMHLAGRPDWGRREPRRSGGRAPAAACAAASEARPERDRWLASCSIADRSPCAARGQIRTRRKPLGPRGG